MSLIQQALEKASRAQETRTTTPAPVLSPKPWELDPSSGPLEKTLTEVQRKNIARNHSWKWILSGSFFLCFAAVFAFSRVSAGSHRMEKSGVLNVVAPTAALQMPIRVLAGPIYRLTGITSLGGQPMAVINEEIVGVGAVLPGKAVVKEISHGEVLLDVQGKDLRLRL